MRVGIDTLVAVASSLAGYFVTERAEKVSQATR
jgi:hypothetical protein